MLTTAEGRRIDAFVRWMIRRDMPEVCEIERLSFDVAWTEKDFLRALSQRNLVGMIAEHGCQLVGFMVYELLKKSIYVHNFAVHPAVRRQGVGKAMVDKLVSKLSSNRRTRITLETRESNLAAQLFFARQGFRATKVVRGFYASNGEDAYRMEYRLDVANRE